MNTTTDTDTLPAILILATLRDLGIYVWPEAGSRQLSSPITGSLLDDCKAHGEAIGLLLRTDEDATVLWHRLMRGADVLWDMETAAQPDPRYDRALYGYEYLLVRYEHRDTAPVQLRSLDERIAADRAWREREMGRVAA